MAVDKSILVREVGSTLAVDKQGACAVVLLYGDVVQIVEVIVGVDNGVVDNSVGAVNPCSIVGALSSQTFKVNIADGGDLGVNAVALYFFHRHGSGGGNNGDMLLSDVCVSFFSLFVALQGGYYLICTECENAKENDAQANQRGSNRFLQIIRRPFTKL